MDELYLDNIDEYVNDHDKIVTYKWLSLTLGVHVNTAKQMLYHYLDHKRKECSAQLHATYLVSGKLVDNGQTSHKVSIVREEQLEDVKSKMSLIVSVHVYSVQKALLKDSGPLYAVDYDVVKDNLMNCSRYSAICCASAMPMSSQELQQARETPPPPTPEQKSCTLTNGNNAAPKPSAKAQKGIMSMFSNRPPPKNQDTVIEVKPEQEEDAFVVGGPKSKATSKINPMANFFGNKTSGKCLDSDGSKKKTGKIVKEAEASLCPSSADQQLPRVQPEKRPEAAEAKPAKEAKDSRSCKTKRTEDSDSEQEMEKKKRRRIKRPEPDSSDEDVIPDSPQPAPPREPSPIPKMETESFSHLLQKNPGGRIRKRRRVLKSRTFLDDEGCIVTEKGYESESYSEEESAPAPKPAPKCPAPAKPQSGKDNESKNNKKNVPHGNKGSKQASIMGFFQKK